MVYQICHFKYDLVLNPLLVTPLVSPGFPLGESPPWVDTHPCSISVGEMFFFQLVDLFAKQVHFLSKTNTPCLIAYVVYTLGSSSWVPIGRISSSARCQFGERSTGSSSAFTGLSVGHQRKCFGASENPTQVL